MTQNSSLANTAIPPAFDQAVLKARTQFDSKSIGDLRETAARLDREFQKVANDVGPEADVMACDSLNGETAAERVEHFEKMHIDACAAKDALSAKEAVAAQVALIQSANSGGGDRVPAHEAADYARGTTPAERLPVSRGMGDLIDADENWLGAKRMLNGGQVEIKATVPEILNATMTTSAGWPPESVRSDKLELSIQRELDFVDLLPVITTNQALYKYMAETTFTNSAAPRNENAALAASALQLTEREVTPRSIGTTIGITKEQMDDEMGVRQYLNARLGYMVRRALEDQLISGNGTAPNVQGILGTTGIGTAAKAAGVSILNALFQSQVTVRTAAETQPQAYVVHPTNWATAYILSDNNGAGWLWGRPGDPVTTRLWGLPMVVTTGMTEHTALVGAFRGFCALISRAGLMVESTNSHSDDFVNLRETVRAYVRSTLAVFRPQAFATRTTLNTANSS